MKKGRERGQKGQETFFPLKNFLQSQKIQKCGVHKGKDREDGYQKNEERKKTTETNDSRD